MSNPYRDHVEAYRRSGWAGTLVIPHGKKSPPPAGFTGEGAPWPTNAQIDTWAETGGNIALRLPANVVALDVDRIGEFLELTKTLGPLPPTWRSVGARDPGHLYFRLPDGVTYRDLKAPCAGVDLLRHSHRYSVVWPSLHPDGMTYRWEAPATAHSAIEIPRPQDLPFLPVPWVAHLQGPVNVPAPNNNQSLSANPWDAFTGPASAQLGEPILDNHDDALARYTASLCSRGYGREEALVLALRRAEDCVGGDPTRPFTERDFDRWWRGAEAKFTPVEPLPGLTPAIRHDEATGEALEPTPYEREVAKEATRLKVAAEARRLVAQGETPDLPEWLPSMRAELALPPEPIDWAIEGLLPAGGNAVLTAGFKAGKTTTMLNLVKALVDGEPFLGQFTARRARVGLFNYEVSARQLRQWVRDAQIDNLDDMVTLHLRGHRLPLTDPVVADRLVEWLRTNRIDFWVVDPLGPALAGTDENSNTDVRQVLSALDEIKERAGVTDLVVTHHTGRGSESQNRARGATVVDDWPDARWILTRPQELDDMRFLKADGRDVSIGEQQLLYDPDTRRLTLGGGLEDSRVLIDRARDEAGAVALARYVTARPGLRAGAAYEGIGVKDVAGSKALRKALELGLVRVEDGPGNSKLLHPKAA